MMQSRRRMTTPATTPPIKPPLTLPPVFSELLEVVGEGEIDDVAGVDDAVTMGAVVVVFVSGTVYLKRRRV